MVVLGMVVLGVVAAVAAAAAVISSVVEPPSLLQAAMPRVRSSAEHTPPASDREWGSTHP
jgi:hypothetical protein